METEQLGSGGSEWSWPTGELGPTPTPSKMPVQEATTEWLGEEPVEERAPVEDIWAQDDEDDEHSHKILMVEPKITRGSRELSTMLLVGLLLLSGTSVVQALRVHFVSGPSVQVAGPHQSLEKAQLLLDSGDEFMQSKDYDSAATQYEGALVRLNEAKAQLELFRHAKARLAEAYDSAGRLQDAHPLWVELKKSEHFGERAKTKAAAAEKRLRVQAVALLEAGEKAIETKQLSQALEQADLAQALFRNYGGNDKQRASAAALAGRVQLLDGKQRLARVSFAEAQRLDPKGDYEKWLERAGAKIATAKPARPKPKKLAKRPSAIPQQETAAPQATHRKVNKPSPAKLRKDRRRLASTGKGRALSSTGHKGATPKPMATQPVARTDSSGRVFVSVTVSNPAQSRSRSGKLVVRLSHNGHVPQGQGWPNPLEMHRDIPAVPAGGKAKIEFSTPFESKAGFQGIKKRFKANNVEPGREVSVSMSAKIRS